MPKLEPGLVCRMDEEYFRKVEAIEFAVKYEEVKNSEVTSRPTWW